MNRLMTGLLPLCLVALASPVMAQGTKGPAGPDTPGAELQAESTHPDALSGKAGTPREDAGERPAPSAERSTEATAAPTSSASADEAKAKAAERRPANPEVSRPASEQAEHGRPTPRTPRSQ